MLQLLASTELAKPISRRKKQERKAAVPSMAKEKYYYTI
jgi:hypothetical protein